MLRPVKSPVLDFKILFLALLMLGVLAAISTRLWFIQIRMNVYYCSRIQGRSEVTIRIPAIRGEIRDPRRGRARNESSELLCRILSPGVGERIHEEIRPATDDRISNRGFQ